MANWPRCAHLRFGARHQDASGEGEAYYARTGEGIVAKWKGNPRTVHMYVSEILIRYGCIQAGLPMGWTGAGRLRADFRLLVCRNTDRIVYGFSIIG
jgi:hypothetical protein